MKRLLSLALLLLFCCLLCGCAQVVNPLVKNEATEAPGLSDALHSATASKGGESVIKASLYFRFLDEPMLAAESRNISVDRGKSAELAVLEALLAGPSASGVELTRLFPEAVQVEDVSVENGVLFVTLGDALFDDETPEDWLTRPEWREEAPLRRRLAIQSIAATITESFPHYAVQIMVRDSGDAHKNTRLDSSYFLSELTGPSEPQTRAEALLLTPHNTAVTILELYMQRDFERLYKYIALYNGNELKPTYEAFADALGGAQTLLSANVSAGSVSFDGSRTVLSAGLVFGLGSASESVPAYPLSLVRENGIWKIAYSELWALANAAGGGDL